MERLICLLLTSCFSVALFAQTPNEFDRWAGDNIGYYSAAPRSEIVVLPLFQQQALYNLFSPEKRVEMWEYKTDDIRNSETLTGAEKKILLKFLKKYVKVQYLDVNADKKNRDRFQKAGDALELTLKQRHNWDDRKIFLYLECWMTEAEIEAYCAEYNIEK